MNEIDISNRRLHSIERKPEQREPEWRRRARVALEEHGRVAVKDTTGAVAL